MAEEAKKPWFHFRTLSRDVVGHLIAYALIGIGSLLLSLIASVKISDVLLLSSGERAILIIAVCTLVSGLLLYFILRKRKRKNIPQFLPTKSDFYVLEKEFTHEYLEKEKIKHTRRWKLRAVRDGVSSFTDKFFWTGHTYTFRSTIDEHRVISAGNRNLFDIYIYQFDRVLKNGQEISIEVEWILEGKHKHFVSTPIEEPTDLLIMKIIFPHEWNITKVLLDESGTLASKVPDSQKEVALERGMYKWAISNPKLLHHYEIKWNLNNK